MENKTPKIMAQWQIYLIGLVVSLVCFLIGTLAIKLEFSVSRPENLSSLKNRPAKDSLSPDIEDTQNPTKNLPNSKDLPEGKKYPK